MTTKLTPDANPDMSTDNRVKNRVEVESPRANTCATVKPTKRQPPTVMIQVLSIVVKMSGKITATTNCTKANKLKGMDKLRNKLIR